MNEVEQKVLALTNRQNLRKQVLTVLTESKSLIKATDLAKEYKVPATAIYGIIRYLREGDAKHKPVGIHTLRGGYLLSQYADQRQDVQFMRRLNGIRTGVCVMLIASEPWMRKRWDDPSKKNYNLIMKPLMGSTSVLKQGLSVLKKRTLKFKKFSNEE